MNILIVTQMYPQPDDLGGNKVTKTVEYFAKEWVAEGHKVVVMHTSSKFPFILYMIPKKIKDRFAYKKSMIIPAFSSRKRIFRENLGIKIYRQPMLKLLPGRSYSRKKIERVSIIIEKILTREHFQPDLVIGHFANPCLEIVANLSEHYKSMSSIVFHNDYNQDLLKKYRILDNVRRIKAVGVRSIVKAKIMKELLGLEKEPFVCSSGVPNDAVEAAERLCSKHDYKNGTRHVYVGSLIERKHLDTIIEAFSNICNSNDSLEIIGGGPEEEKLKKIVFQLGLKNVSFIGRLPRNEVFAHMKFAHIFTLVSDNEVFGMVYIEAMLQGCIVIASKNGGFDGIIRDGYNGFICNPGDMEMLINIYKKINCLSIEERNIIGQNAINTAMNYSEKDVADRYLQNVLERNGE